MIVVVCDNGGFAVINRLQNFKGGASFNNLIADCRVKAPFAVDFAKHAESMGALARQVESLADLETRSTGPRTTTGPRSSRSSPTPTTGYPGDAGGMSVCRRSASGKRSAPRAQTTSRSARKQRVGV